MLEINKTHQGCALELLKHLDPESINCCVTSPPYFGLRDYGIPPTKWPEVSFSPMAGLPEITIPAMTSCLGLEKDLWAFIGHIVLIFRGVKNVLKKDGVLWLNFGDSYAANGGYKTSSPGGKQISNQGSLIDRVRKPGQGLKQKDLIGIPWRVAFTLQADGWYLRQDIIWHKPNPMPESCKDRCTKAHEYMFLLSKSQKYYCDMEAIKEPCSPNTSPKISKNKIKEIEQNRKNKKIKVPSGWETEKGSHGNFHKKGRASEAKYKNTNIGCSVVRNKTHTVDGMVKSNISYENAICLPTTYRNKRSVWTIATYPFKQAHFATFPPKLIEPCIRAGCPKNGIVLDPFIGSGTTGFVAVENNRKFIGFEIDGECIEKIANQRIKQAEPELF